MDPIFHSCWWHHLPFLTLRLASIVVPVPSVCFRQALRMLVLSLCQTLSLVLTWGQFCLHPTPQRHLAISRVIWVVTIWQGVGWNGGCYWCLVSRGQGRCLMSYNAQGSLKTKTYLAQNVSSAKVEKSCPGASSSFMKLFQNYAELPMPFLSPFLPPRLRKKKKTKKGLARFLIRLKFSFFTSRCCQTLTLCYQCLNRYIVIFAGSPKFQSTGRQICKMNSRNNQS